MSLAQYMYDHIFSLQRNKTIMGNVGSKIKKDFYYGNTEDNSESGSLTREVMALTVAQEPLIRKGIWKENRDIFKDGWEIVGKKQNDTVPDDIIDLIEDFNHNCQIQYKYEQAGISSNIYGDGFLEILWDEPQDTRIDSPPPTTSPVDLKIYNAEYIDHTEHKNQNDPLGYYIYKEPRVVKQYIHPGRLQHIVKKRIPGKLFGISDVYTCSKTLTSKMNADEQYGEFIEWMGAGAFDVMIKGATRDDLLSAEKVLKHRHNINLHNEETEWKTLNPVIFNPKDFNDWFLINIGAVRDMPYYMLAGTQPGQLTGSEMGFMDYMNHIKSLRENVFSYHIEKLYDMLLKGNGYGEGMQEYRIRWKESYIDEQAEANILKMRTDAAGIALDHFAIDENEFRDIMKQGIKDMEQRDVIGDVPPPVQPQAPVIVQPVQQPAADKTVVQSREYKKQYPDLLTTEERLKLEKDKLRGKLEMLRQEERLDEAEKTRKTKKTTV